VDEYEDQVVNTYALRAMKQLNASPPFTLPYLTVRVLAIGCICYLMVTVGETCLLELEAATTPVVITGNEEVVVVVAK